MADDHHLSTHDALEGSPHDANMDVVRALGRHVVARSTDMIESNTLVPPFFYRDPERDRAEREHVFMKLPMLVGLTQDVAKPGDVFTFDEFGPPILVVRQKDGSLKAFMNMCMHRAVRLVSECGHKARISCPFHGWTYGLDGKLIGVPRKEAFDPDLLTGRNLMRVPVGEWGGLIFVKLYPGEEEIDVKAWVGEFAPLIEMFDLANSHRLASDRLDFASNWKFALDTYCEGYHIGFLHINTVGQFYYGDLMKYDTFGLHHRIAFAPKTYQALVGQDEAGWPAIPYSPVYYLFPNIALNIQPMDHGGSFVSVHRLYPGKTVDEGFSILSTYKLGGAPTEEDRASYEAAHALIMKTVGTEDYALCGPAYRNLASAPEGFRSLIGRNELGIQRVHQHLAEATGMPIDRT